jgi:excinuclease UvrABC helicase subunit UvrB
MMNTRSKAHTALRRGAFKTALAFVDAGLNEIRNCQTADADSGESAEEGECREIAILQSLRAEIASRLTPDPVHELESRLARAIHEERFEEAAELRDRLVAMKAHPQSESPGDDRE